MNKFLITTLLLSNVLAVHSLQIGDYKEKFRVDLSTAHDLGEIEQRAIRSTVKVLNYHAGSHGTGFFYKSIGDNFYFITNNHVMSTQRECDKAKIIGIDDEFNSKNFKCDKIIKTAGRDAQSDFTVFTLKDSEYVSKFYKDRENTISEIDPIPGDELVTAGFGSRKLDKRFDISLSNDADCMVLAGPIRINLQDYSMDNTLSLGCDISSGDSGSAIFNKNSGELVAILFASGVAEKKSIFASIFGRDDKDKESKILTSREIREHLNEPGYYRFWKLGSFASQLNRLDLGVE